MGDSNETETPRHFGDKALNFLNGKNCLPCTVVATVTPLAMAGRVAYVTFTRNYSYLSPMYKYALYGFHGSMIFGFLSMAFMSVSRTWAFRSADETFLQFLERDRQNRRTAINKLRDYRKTAFQTEDESNK